MKGPKILGTLATFTVLATGSVNFTTSKVEANHDHQVQYGAQNDYAPFAEASLLGGNKIGIQFYRDSVTRYPDKRLVSIQNGVSIEYQGGAGSARCAQAGAGHLHFICPILKKIQNWESASFTLRVSGSYLAYLPGVLAGNGLEPSDGYKGLTFSPRSQSYSHH